MKYYKEFPLGTMFGDIKYIGEDFYKVDPKWGKKRRVASFECYCGNKFVSSFSAIKRGVIKSCGCYTIKRIKEVTTKHGLNKHPLYGIWQDIKNRCGNPNVSSYKNYGAKGIIICDEWKSEFLPFYNWSIENGWKEGLTIDRIDTTGNYCPENCRWTTFLVQARNRNSNIFVEYDGRQVCLKDYCSIKDLPYGKIRLRMTKFGWSFEKAISTPIKRKDILTVSSYEEFDYSI